jgi:hypothetical protein
MSGPDPRDHHQGSGNVDAVDAREVYPAHFEQPGAQVEHGRIAGPTALLSFRRLSVVHLQALQLLLDRAVALAELRAVEVE